MAPRDSPEQSEDDPATDQGDVEDAAEPNATRAREGSIDVEQASDLTSSEIEADPVEETEDYLVEVAKASVEDPKVAGDQVGTLLAILRAHSDDLAEDADLILDQLGSSRPEEFEVWVHDLAGLAKNSDGDVAFVGMRSLAQLATVNEESAKSGIDAALTALNAGRSDRRRAAIAHIAEVGEAEPEAVRSADSGVSSALRAEDPGVRLAGAIAAGRLLAAAPTTFPRTANALPERLDDPDDRVERYVHVSLAHVAREQPAHLPETERVLDALATTSDRDLGLREGSTGEALATALEHVDVR